MTSGTTKGLGFGVLAALCLASTSNSLAEPPFERISRIKGVVEEFEKEGEGVHTGLWTQV